MNLVKFGSHGEDTRAPSVLIVAIFFRIGACKNKILGIQYVRLSILLCFCLAGRQKVVHE